MHKLKSLGSYYLASRDMTIYFVESPVAGPRDSFFLFVLGDVEIDGVRRYPVGVEWHCLGRPVQAGEKIGLVVPT